MQAIAVNKLGKKYTLLSAETGGILQPVRRFPSNIISSAEKLVKFEFWALQDVSFTLEQGRMLGVIGDNGSGKSTLLKLLAGSTYPDTGEIYTKGKVAAMLELGVGFHPDLSGIENIFLNGTLLGMTHRQIVNNLERIIDFSGLREFINAPVRHYSAGMFARLGFSIAIHSEPDILLVDEILAVGDMEFQLRCIEEIKRLRAIGKTIVLVSHNITLIEMLTDEVIWLENGRIKESGKPTEVCHNYRQIVDTKEKREAIMSHPYFQALTEINKPRIFSSAVVQDMEGNYRLFVKTGESLQIIINYNTSQSLKYPCLSVLFRYVERDIPVAEITSARSRNFPDELCGRGRFVLNINPLLLLKGKYELSAVLYNLRDQREIYDALINFQTIDVETRDEFLPAYLIIKPPCQWHHISIT
ncbi:MAG: ABC transporter ATP-binding protein [Candidatus Sumerlaeia bacterium]|nr:ABC transporter ATP-binding protein [Candidatus Sumerlaeia bacterium]